MSYPVRKGLCKLIKYTRPYIVVILIGWGVSSCNSTYSTLSFDNQSYYSIYLEYTQENGSSLKQEIDAGEDLNMMFDKRWSDKSIRNVVNNIKEIVIYNQRDTLLHVTDKNQLFDLFKTNRSEIFHDRITLQIK